MLVGCLGLLIAASGFLTEFPEGLKPILAPEKEIRGTFVQTKTTAEGEKYVMEGEYTIRPDVDFTWKTLEPFETVFHATKTSYSYDNFEDEKVEKPLKEKFDEKTFFKLFDALYKEEDGKFFLKAKPKTGELKKALSKVEAEGKIGEWTLRIEFPNKTAFLIEFKDDVR